MQDFSMEKCRYTEVPAQILLMTDGEMPAGQAFPGTEIQQCLVACVQAYGEKVLKFQHVYAILLRNVDLRRMDLLAEATGKTV